MIFRRLSVRWLYLLPLSLFLGDATAFVTRAAESLPGLVLHVPFQGTATPAAGNLAAESGTNNLRFVPGHAGQALALDAASARLAYGLPLDPLRGSIAFWLKLDQAPALTAKPIRILTLQGGKENFEIRAEINVHKTLLLAAASHRIALCASTNTAQWLSQWHHVAFTWTGTFMHGYVDGIETRSLLFSGGDDETDRPITGRLEEPFSFPPPEVGSRLRFSNGETTPAVQDLVVFGWALSPKTVRQLTAGARPETIRPEAPVLDVTWGPGAKRVDLIVDAAPGGMAPASADIRIVNAVNGKQAGRGALADWKGNQGSACVYVPLFDSGTYRVDVELKDAKGKGLGSVSSEPYAFDRGKYPWLWNTFGFSDDVPAPWTPIEVKKNRGSVWGRTYDFGMLWLPREMTSADRQILSRPIELIAETPEGVVALKSVKQPSWDDILPGRATGRTRAGSETLRVDSTVTLDYDGTLSFAIRLASRDVRNPAGLNALYLDIPLKEAHAKLLNAWAGLSFAGYVPAGTGQVWNAFGLPRKPGQFVPFIWVGDDDRGLAWFADQDSGFARSGTNAPIEVIRQAGEVVVRIHLVDRPITLDKPRTLSFGLMATPVKPMPPRWRAMEFGGTPIQEGANYFWWWPGTAGRRTTGWAGFEPYPNPPAEARAFAQQAHGNGQYVVPFLNAHFNGGLPAHDFWEELRRFPDGGLVYQNITRTIADYNLYHLDQWSRGEGAIDGLYIDESYLCGPAINPLGGMGYYDEEGTAFPGYGLLSVRDYFRRLYLLFRKNGRNGMIWQHSTLFHIPMIAAYAGTTCDGENDLATPTDDYIDHLLAPDPVDRSDFKGRLGRLRAIGRSQNYGVPGSYLRYTTPAHDPALVAQHAAVMGLCDIIPVEEHALFRTAKLEFDIGAEDVQFWPFWDETPRLTVEPASVLVSVYHRRDRDLLYVVNTSRSPVDATITFLPDSGIHLPGKTVYDPFTRKPPSCTEQTLQISLEGHGHKLLMIMPPAAERAPTGICFQAGFDGSPKAEAARGSAYGRAAGSQPQFADGHSSQGLVIGHAQGLLHYMAADNVCPENGTMQFWLKRRQPITQWFQFLSLPAGPGIQFGLGTESLKPLVMNIGSRWQPTSAKQPPWETNVWRRVTVTWSGSRQCRLYLDGMLSDSLTLAPDTALPEFSYPGWIILGSIPRQGDTSSDLVIDELTLYDHCLSDEEIKTGAFSHAPKQGESIQ